MDELGSLFIEELCSSKVCINAFSYAHLLHRLVDAFIESNVKFFKYHRCGCNVILGVLHRDSLVSGEVSP